MLRRMAAVALAASVTTGCGVTFTRLSGRPTAARGVGWFDVMQLAPGVPVNVETRAGVARRGRLIAADCLGVRVDVDGREEWIAARAIVLLERLDQFHDGRNRVSPTNAAWTGAIVGALAAAVLPQAICLSHGQWCSVTAKQMALGGSAFAAMFGATAVIKRPATVFRGPAQRDSCPAPGQAPL